MSSLSFTLIPSNELQDSLAPKYFEFDRLADVHRTANRAANKKVLSDAMTVISQELPLAQWEPSLCGRFLKMACLLARHEATEVLKEDGADAGAVQAVRDRADWLCSFAVAAGGQLDAPAREQACGVWVLSQLAAGLPEQPEQFVQEAVTALAPVGLPEADLAHQARAQLVLHAHRRLSTGRDAGALVEPARAWCRELVLLPQFNGFLARAAATLGVEVPKLERPADNQRPPGVTPTPPEKEEAEQQPEPAADARAREPRFFTTPEPATDKDVQQEFQRCLLKLLAVSREQNSPLTPMTARQIATTLRPDSDFAKWSTPVHFAARDLWKAYWSRGDEGSLELARRLALLQFRGASLVRGQERERAHALHLWMCTRLPELITTCDLDLLVEDAALLWSSLGCRDGDLQLREGMVEAHAGQCRRMRADGDAEGADTLVRDNADALKRVHEEYLQSARAPSEDEFVAWEYLFPQAAQAPEAAQLPPEAPTSILQDPDFLQVAKKGEYEPIYEFVEHRLKEIQEMLVRRLDVRLSVEHVMMPEGKIFADNAAKRGQPDARFVNACEMLKKDEYQRAATAFDRLAKTLQGHRRDICRNFQAYALARQGEPVLARGHLIDLPQTRFHYPSAYWNLACCIPSEQNDQRLAVLAQGLEYAPHWDLLRGLVYLALLLEDRDQLCKWLPCLTFTEARLLSYYHRYAEMDNAARDRAVVQLGRYRAHGEPEVPDPTDHRLPIDQMNRFIEALMELHQEPTIDFWLRCREWVGRNRYDYWQVRTDFLLRSQRPRLEAAKAMREELECRLEALDTGRNTTPGFINYTRSRIEEALRLCMTPELRNVGHDIYNMVDTFDKKYPEVKPLLPRHQQIRRFYEEADGQGGGGKEGGVTTGGKVKEPARGPAPEAAGKPAAPVNLDALLAQAGAECNARLHEVAHLPVVRRRLDEVADGLRQQQPDSAGALDRLLGEWEGYGRHAGQGERQAALQRAQAAYAELRGRLEHDLSSQQMLLAGQLLGALQRVNSRLARDLDLLPRLTAEALDGEAAAIDPAAAKTAFAIRVRGEAGGEAGAPPVRLRQAVATLDDGETEFPLRDRLDDVPALVSADQSALLTFGWVPFRGPRQGRAVRLVLTYEFAGSRYTSEQLTVPLAFAACPPLPEQSPYISGRGLEPHEIEGHFFGREKEQELILESVKDGQQKIRYVEGIRKAGKSSLLHSIEHEIDRRGLPLIPVYWSTTAVTNCDHAGRILFNLLDAVAKHEKLATAGLVVPEEARCCENLPRAYDDFNRELEAKVRDRRVLVLVDDFQVLVETGNAAERGNPTLHTGIIGLLNKVYGSARPQARLLWLFAGHRASRQYRTLLPGPLLWGTMRALPIDFLPLKAVGEIIQAPLAPSAVHVPPETVLRVHAHTAGHPEIVQQLAELMLQQARDERRPVLTPADADAAAQDLAAYSDTFADTWYPMAELSREQRDLIAAFVAVVPPGGRIEPHRLVPGNKVTEAHKTAIDDLAARKILDVGADGSIGIKAYVLDLWLHRSVPRMIQDRANGAVAIFIDVANLTHGKGRAVLQGLRTSAGEGIPGQFGLASVLDRIERFAGDCSPAPVAARWVVNYPPKSPAVAECNAKGYYVENIPPDLFKKGDGQDDVLLREKIWEVERQYPTVNHFVLVLGDKDYRITVEKLLHNGKLVHVVARDDTLAKPDTKYSYDSIARQYPTQFTLHRLEELLDGGQAK
jgi:hypothetical protein